jgi:hypothetical protein
MAPCVPNVRRGAILDSLFGTNVITIIVTVELRAGNSVRGGVTLEKPYPGNL